MELAIFSSNTELARAVADEIVAAGHVVRLVDIASDWASELGQSPVRAVIFDVAADNNRAASVSKSMRRASGAGRIRQIAVVAEDRVAIDSAPPTVDELVVYPFRPGELAARLRLIEGSARTPSGTTFVFGNVVIDTEAYEVTLDAVPVALTFKEQELLNFLATNPGKVFSRSQLLSTVWGYDYFGGTRTVDVHVRRLRFKLGPEIEARIQTVRNVGYRFASNI